MLKLIFNQRGIAPGLILVIAALLLVIIGGIYFQINYRFSQPVSTNSFPQPNSSLVTNVNPIPPASTKAVVVPIKVTTTLRTPTPTPHLATGSNPILPTAEVVINAAGSYAYSGQQITYLISFPKEGGKVAGNVSGICTGTINGNFSGGDGGLLSSSVDAKCRLGPLSQDLKGDFSGPVYFSKGEADLEWQGSIPFYSGSKQFSLTFSPL